MTSRKTAINPTTMMCSGLSFSTSCWYSLPLRRPMSDQATARTVRAVAWSLIGLRKGSEYQQDVEKLNPIHIIVVGLMAVFLLVIGLIGLVNWIV